MKHKGFWFVMIAYVVLMIADMYSTLKGGFDLANALEANPIVDYIGFSGLIILNVLVIIMFWYVYTQKNIPKVNFVIITCMFFMILTRIMVVKQNLEVQDMELTLEAAKNMVTPGVKAATLKKYAIMLYTPIVCSMIPFFIWGLDHKIEKK